MRHGRFTEVSVLIAEPSANETDQGGDVEASAGSGSTRSAIAERIWMRWQRALSFDRLQFAQAAAGPGWGASTGAERP